MLYLKSPALARALRFWKDIARINDVVAAQVTAPGAVLWDIQLKIRETIGPDSPLIIRRIMAFTLELLDLPRRPGYGQASDALGAPLQQFVLNCDLVLGNLEQRWLGEKERQTRSNELLMENLTAAWLALYFLGVPFIHPWEKVRRLADYRGGFPSGGCIAKYIGDVYRLARHRFALPDLPAPQSCSSTQPGEVDPSAVLVLSHTPMVLFEAALTYSNDAYATPVSVHELGRRYALLQMMLYIRCGHPVHFLIPVTALRQALNKLAGFPDDPAATGTPDMWMLRAQIRDKIKTWLFGTIFTSVFSGQSVRLLKYPLDASGMPTCVLGTKTGIYTLESGGTGLHFAGNELRDSLLESYRDKLSKVLEMSDRAPQSAQRAVNLLDLNAGSFARELEEAEGTEKEEEKGRE